MADDRIRIVVEPDTTGFQSELTNDLSRVNSSFDVNVHADTTAAAVAIQRWETKEQADPIEKNVTVDTTRARALLASFQSAASVPIQKVVNMNTTGAQKSLRQLGNVGSKAMATLGTAAKGAGIGALLAVGSAALAGKDELIEMERVSAQTAATLASTGNAAGASQKQIEALAGSIAKKSGLDDQAIQSGQNLLLTFTGIKNEIGAGNDIFNQATQTMTDLSVAMGSEPKNAAIQLGKALNNPVKGVSALSKVGVSFTEQQKEQIKTLVESGDTMAAQKIILAELNKEFGGSAAARGKTFEGQMTNISEAVAGAGAAILSKLLPGIKTVASAFESAFSDDGLVTRFLDALKPLGSVLGTIGSAFSTAFAGVGEGQDWIESLGAAMEQLAVFVKENETNITAFGLIIKDLVVEVGKLIKTLGPMLFPVLKMFGLLVAGLVVGIVKVVTWIVQAVNWFLQFKGALGVIALALAAFLGWPALIATAIGLLVAVIVRNFDNIIAFFAGIPGKVWGAMKTLGAILKRVFVAALNLAITGAKVILNLYIAYLRAVPLRILNAIISLGQMLWTFITNVWNKFKSITVTLVTAYINFVRSIPGKILSAIGNVAKLLYDKGKEIFEGLFDGLKAGWNKVKDWLGGIGDKIKSLKGPIEVDRTLLVDEGRAIMGGFHKGLKEKWDGVAGWLSERGGFITGLLSKVGLGKVTDAVSKLFTGEIGIADVNAVIDKESMGGMHPSSGPADTWAMANIIAKKFNVLISSFIRPGARTTSGNISQHASGMAVDFSNGSNPTPEMDRLAAWAYKLIGKAFYQVLYRTMVGGNHFNHVHIGWIPRRHGGNVRKSGHYMTGEEGPEPFIPNSSGFILSNARLDRMLNVDRRLGTLERGARSGAPAGGAQVHQEVTINMPPINAADGQGWAMLSTNRLLEMLRANAVGMAGGVA